VIGLLVSFVDEIGDWRYFIGPYPKNKVAEPGYLAPGWNRAFHLRRTSARGCGFCGHWV